MLLTAWKGVDKLTVIKLLDDPNRRFFSSELVRLELLPKATFHKQKAEVQFYATHLDSVEDEAKLTIELGRAAFSLACHYGLSAIDALHVAAAIALGVEEFVTTELPGKPLFRVKHLRVTSLHDLALE